MASRKGLRALAVKSIDGQDNTLRVLSPIDADFARARFLAPSHGLQACGAAIRGVPFPLAQACELGGILG